MNTKLKLFFSALMLYMVYVVVSTSLRSNLFQVWSSIGAEPWNVATLKDFYINIAIISSWVVYKERSWTPRILWIIGFIVLGSILTCAYVLKELFKLKEGESLDTLLVRRNG